MKTATVADLRNHFTRLAKWIEEGQPISITRRGQTFAMLSPSQEKPVSTEWPDLPARRTKPLANATSGNEAPETLDYARGDY